MLKKLPSYPQLEPPLLGKKVTEAFRQSSFYMLEVLKDAIFGCWVFFWGVQMTQKQML